MLVNATTAIILKYMWIKSICYQNYNEVSPHSHQSTIIEKLQTLNTREGVEKREPSGIVGGDVNWYNHYGEQYGAFF